MYSPKLQALLSLNFGFMIPSCVSLMSRLSHLLPSCGLSYLSLLTGSDVDAITNIVIEEKDDFISCLSYIKLGASLSVIWGLVSDDVAQAAGQNISAVKDELQTDQTARWQAVVMFKHLLMPVGMPWKLKRHSMDFLLSITSKTNARNEEADCSLYMPRLFVALQALTKFIICEPEASLRKDAFQALKMVLADIPVPQRFDILHALIIDSDSPSMIALLLDLARGELHKSCQRMSTGTEEVLPTENQSHWTSGVLELVELVLRPPGGVPPSFPEQGDAVLAALNLYRFILISESAGKIHTGALSKATLLKAYNEWLLPLRTLVMGIMAVNKDGCDPDTVDAICALNPVELVLYRCIELVEEKMKDAV
ncbi:hypothetical protein Tsubulata_015210 [Turnera subulata]|uniref:Aberrant root formation protein 4 n=1 Tax=Turnera subulata TaxID=218843 RepID=A0A9Q0F9C6_9ROSI|nr:hypothetical protein Tsubulata_015210 [Turnera subulata]